MPGTDVGNCAIQARVQGLCGMSQMMTAGTRSHTPTTSTDHTPYYQYLLCQRGPDHTPLLPVLAMSASTMPFPAYYDMLPCYALAMRCPVLSYYTHLLIIFSYCQKRNQSNAQFVRMASLSPSDSLSYTLTSLSTLLAKACSGQLSVSAYERAMRCP
eukprot:1737599-Rhodomonas_salina.4